LEIFSNRFFFDITLIWNWNKHLLDIDGHSGITYYLRPETPVTQSLTFLKGETL